LSRSRIEQCRLSDVRLDCTLWVGLRAVAGNLFELRAVGRGRHFALFCWMETSMLQTIPRAAAESPSFPSLTRIRAEYLEMPGLALTLVQAARLWGC